MDISVYDNYSGTPRDFDFFFIDGKYKTCDSMLAIICISGEAEFRIRMQSFPIRKSGYLVIRPDMPFYIKSKSDDFKIDVIRIGYELFEELSSSVTDFHPEWLIYDSPMSILEWSKTRMFHIIHSYIKTLLDKPHDWYNNQLIIEYLRIFYLEACRIWESTSTDKANSFKRERIITCEFFKNADRYFRENRKVESYAEMIGISAKHLAHTIYKTTGKYPSEWLESYALLEAKKMLRNSEDTIQEISYDLNFATPSHFSRFFKSKTGMSPKEFRNQELIIAQ